MNTQKSRNSADKTINFVIILIIVAILAAGSWAVYGKISSNLLDKAIADGTAPQTVETYARQADLSVEDYLASYEITDPSVNGKTSMTDLLEVITVKSYALLSGSDFDTFVAENNLTDKVTADTLWSEAQLLIPLGKYIGGDEYVEEFKSYYELDASVNAETPWGDLADIVAEKDAQKAAEAEAAAEATAEAETEATTEADTAAQESADATPAAAE